MSSRIQVYLFAAVFTLLGIGLTYYKVSFLGLPLLPGSVKTVWSIEAKLTFNSWGDAVVADLALPESQGNYEILDETFASSGYGFVIDNKSNQRRAVWTRRAADGQQILYYKLQIAQDSEGLPGPQNFPTEVSPPPWKPPQYAAAEGLLREARERSADSKSLAEQLLKLLADRETFQDANMLFESAPDLSPADLAVDLLSAADIPVHMVRGVQLENRGRNLPPAELVEIYDGATWRLFDPVTAEQGLPENFFIWQRGGQSLLDVVGGHNSRVRFSMISNDVPVKSLLPARIAENGASLAGLSIYSLPVDKQAIFKSLLLIPIGALIVVFFRIVVGLRTSGTFMPVLLALAFIQTSLLTGILILIALVLVGLLIRTYLSRLDLLMMARIGAVLIVVVFLMAGFSVMSYRFGMDQVLTITFLPMVIVAWTIERMSITWEEDGAKEVMIQGTGSLLVATIAFLVMTNSVVGHLTYNFPELLLVVLGLILILGQYTGLRISELYRFRHMDT